MSTEDSGTYLYSMRGGGTNTSRNCFETLLNIYDKTTLDGRRIDPFSVLVQHL